MIPLGEAQRFVLSTLRPLPVVELPLNDALGRVVGEEIVAREPVPGFANSSMDGYALRSVDVQAPRSGSTWSARSWRATSPPCESHRARPFA